MKIKIKTFFWLISFTFFSIFFLTSCKDSKVVDSKIYNVNFLDIMVDPTKYQDKNILIVCDLSWPNTERIICNDPLKSRSQLMIENQTMKHKEQLKWVFQFCNSANGIDSPGCKEVRVSGILRFNNGLFGLKQAEFIP
jgi:hypothetical protein